MTYSVIAGAAFASAIIASPLLASAETFSGKVVDLATYVTRDHNMDAMRGAMGHAMKGSMHGGSPMGHACPPTLGLVAHGGVSLYLLVTQMGSKTGDALCKLVDKTVTLDATPYEQGGIRALLVSTVK
jgi:hypothetical protein